MYEEFPPKIPSEVLHEVTIGSAILSLLLRLQNRLGLTPPDGIVDLTRLAPGP